MAPAHSQAAPGRVRGATIRPNLIRIGPNEHLRKGAKGPKKGQLAVISCDTMATFGDHLKQCSNSSENAADRRKQWQRQTPLRPFRRISPGSRLMLESGSAGPARRPVSSCAGVRAGPEPAGRDPAPTPGPSWACIVFLRTAAGPRHRTAAPAQPAARSVRHRFPDRPAPPPRGCAGEVARQRPPPWSRRPSLAQGALPPRPTGLTQTRRVRPPKLPTPPVPPSTPACVDRLWAGTRHRYALRERNRLAEDFVTFPDERSCRRHVEPENVQLSGSRRQPFG